MPSEFAKYAQSMDVGLPQSMIDLLDNLDLGDIASDRFDNESDSDDDDDDGDNDGYKPGAPITEEKPEPPYPLAELNCECKTKKCPPKNKTKKAACCAPWGKGCTENCGCKGTCDNIWNAQHKERLFGKNEKDEKEIFPNPCFVHWYQKMVNRAKEETNVNTLVKKALQGFGKPSEYDEDLKAFAEQWKAVEDRPEDDPERKALAQRLVRFAFTDDRDILGNGETDHGHGWWFSFCRRGSWQETMHTTHCWECGECADWEEWHCGRCGSCDTSEFSPCDGCGGVSEMYHDQHRRERERFGSH